MNRLKPDIVHFNVSFQDFKEIKNNQLRRLIIDFSLSAFLGLGLAALHTLADVADLEKYDVKLA